MIKKIKLEGGEVIIHTVLCKYTFKEALFKNILIMIIRIQNLNA